MNTSETGERHRYEDTIIIPCLRDREMKTPGTQMMKAKLHRLFDTYWKLSDSIDKLREEVWDADDSFHRDVNRIANELEIIRLEEIRVPDTIGYYPSGGGNPRQLGIKDFMEVGVRETDADIEGFREIFGRTVIYGEDEMTLEAYIRTLETDSEFDIEYYCPEKEWISELLSIGSFGIKNLYDGMAGYDIITGEHLSKREKESRFIWGIIETALSIFLAVAAATGLLGKISSKLSQKISPLMEKLEPYIKPYITKIDDAVGQLQRQISQAVQKTGGVVDDTFRLEPVAGETIETLGKEVVQESGEAAGREILQEGSETVETIQSSLDVKEEVQTVVADEVKIGGEGGTSSVPNKGFNSFKDLKAELGSPGEGNAWHHIVEQSQIGKSGFSSNEVNNINNIISIPHGKGTVHAKISGYYSSKQFFTGGQTVRQWLTGQSFQEQFDFGMDLLKQYGTVTPTDNGWIFTPF